MMTSNVDTITPLASAQFANVNGVNAPETHTCARVRAGARVRIYLLKPLTLLTFLKLLNSYKNNRRQQNDFGPLTLSTESVDKWRPNE